MSLFTEPTKWDLDPPEDPAGAQKSAEIDEWLHTERAKELRSNSKTLVLCPDHESFERFKNRVCEYLGETAELDDEIVTKVSTFALSKKEKKVLSGLEPSLLLYVINPGEITDSQQMLMKMTKALSHFLFTTKALGLGKGCVVVIAVAQTDLIVKHMEGENKQEWAKLIPSMIMRKAPLESLMEEFAAAAKMEAKPLKVVFVSDGKGFADLSMIKNGLKEGHAILMNSLAEQSLKLMKTSPEKAEDLNGHSDDKHFQDAKDEGEEENLKRKSFADSQKYVTSAEFRNQVALWGSRIIFGIELLMFAYLALYYFPWGPIERLWLLILDVLHVPQLF